MNTATAPTAREAGSREPRLNRSVGLTDSAWKAARMRAIEEGRTAGELVEEAIRRYIAAAEQGEQDAEAVPEGEAR